MKKLICRLFGHNWYYCYDGWLHYKTCIRCKLRQPNN